VITLQGTASLSDEYRGKNVGKIGKSRFSGEFSGQFSANRSPLKRLLHEM